MKTPCLKCGLIHDEPTAICDGYAGIDPDETAGDTRKQAAERIRAILAAVPIESRRQGRARAAAAGASASQSSDSPPSVPGRTEPPPAEVPEWRREVSERLESYRSRRERQSRQAGTNQSVLAFRVHSKSETLEDVPEAQAAAPAAIGAPAAEPVADSPLPAESAVAPATVDAAMHTASPAAGQPGNGAEALRTYQPIEESEMAADLTADLGSLGSEIRHNGDAEPAALAESIAPSAEAIDSSAGLPLASEPAVVLADSTTLEVHADPVELAEVQTVEPVAAQPLMESAPLATIPAIDNEYWRAVPGVDAEEAECGPLTSRYEAQAAAHEEVTEHVEETEDADETEQEELSAHEETLAEEESELAAVAEAHSVADATEPPAPPPLAEEPAIALQSEASSGEESLFPAALTADEAEETENRRAALRTASRPMPGGVSERIEIRVPQPVFDFSPAAMESQQPQDDALPVADLRERRCAALLDAALLGLTIAGFFLSFHLAGGEFSFSRVGIAVSVAASFLIYAQYVLLFTFMGGATPGMVLRGLRVVCFGGRTPGTVELAWRSFGYLLSAAAGLLGFLWSAWDEHGLSWHDRISQTYITYAEPEAVPAVVSTH